MNVKILIKKIIVCLLAIMPFITLFFNLLSVGETQSSGYSMLGFSSPLLSKQYSWFAGILGIFSIFTLFAGGIGVFLSIKNFNSNKNDKTDVLVMFIALIVTVLYTIEGLVFKVIFNNQVSQETQDFLNVYAKTSSFIPLIIVVIFVAFYFFIPFLDKILKQSIEENESKNAEPIQSAKELAETLKQYKELLDSGIISQEEFDAKKKELLNL